VREDESQGRLRILLDSNLFGIIPGNH
jgi:hypothetical protein